MAQHQNISSPRTYDWEDMLPESDYTTLLFIRELMHKGEYEAAKKGIDKLFEFETKVEKREMKKALVRLMTAIFLWKLNPDYRTGEQVHEIFEAYEDVEYYIEEGTELNYNFLLQVWDEALEDAKDFAEIELQYRIGNVTLSWEEVFEKEYSMFTKNEDDGAKREAWFI